ncbi:MAG: ATP-dependent DNA helicase RecG [Actinobacteria bacterium]|nr:ATP-dependent DNA helicase RecG [Actinomycetota bacterium]
MEKLSRLAAPVTALPGVGPAYARRLDQLDIKTVGDLLYHFPRRYLDRSNVTPIGSVKTGQDATVVGTVCDVESRRTRSRKNILVVSLFDGTGYLSGVWFNQEYHREQLKEGVETAFSGKVQFQYKRLQIVNPSYDVLGGGEEGEGQDGMGPEGEDQGGGPQGIHTGRIIPLYPGTAGVTSAALRKLVSRALDMVGGMADVLPEEVRRTFGLMPLTEALREIHFPGGEETLGKARYRALFDEIFIMQVGLALRKKRREREGGGISHGPPGELVGGFRRSLPFELTVVQEKAWGEIARDMSLAVPMNRLLQGEVGSGKTVVAVQALLLAVDGGYQGAIMAPTEILAHQHYRRIGEMLEGLPVRVGLLTAGTPAEDLRDIASGDVGVVVGTHALIQEGVSFDRLGVVVIDEQHRFGLRQRVTLAAKGSAPDVLHMSATPIPRTLSLTLYGDLDVSVMDELPAGRKGVVTVVADKSQRKGAFAMVGEEVRLGRQVFVICPLVEESEKLEARAAEKEAGRLAGEFPGYDIGLVHGQMKSEDKRRVMERFGAGEIDILISTVMVEVGIDVPNATAMIVEDADRFGLAQLHQLRGRIGRGSERAICVLFADPSTDEAKARMEAIQRYDDGFALAEADLRIRGEGSLFGIRQSGLPDLKLARLSRDFKLIRDARSVAFRLVDRDPVLSEGENVLLRWEANRRFGGTLEWLFHG